MTDSRVTILDETPKVDSFAAFDFFSVKTIYNPLDPFNLEIIDLTKKLVFEKGEKMYHVGILAHPTVHFLMTFST